MARFDLTDGRWVELRPPSVNAILFIDEHLDDKFTFSLPKAGLPELLAHLRRATIDLSWSVWVSATPKAPAHWSNGDIGELSPDEMGDIVGTWYLSGEDDALPPPAAAPSPSSTPQPSSAAPMGRCGRSTHRSHSSSSTPPAS